MVTVTSQSNKTKCNTGKILALSPLEQSTACRIMQVLVLKLQLLFLANLFPFQLGIL